MKKNNIPNILFCIFSGLLIAAVFKIFIIESLSVEGKSMEPALRDKQTIFVNKLAYGLVNPFGAKLIVQWAKPKEDDMVIFLYNNNIVVKRCVATENGTLDYLTNSGYILLVNLDRQIPLTEEQFQKMKKCSVVPDGYILAVGDNYTQSFDSRNYGFIPVSNILGKVICR